MTEGLEAEALVATGLAHGFFTRRGGVSRGVYRSLNVGLGSGDDPAHVAENRARAMRALGADALATPYQVHGAAVHVLTERADETAPPPRADAMVTTRRGIAIGVVTADCVPVLLADAGAGVIAAAHAGWRGALAGICSATVSAMEGLGARRARIRAAIGPAIAQGSYEVGPEVRDAFLAALPPASRFFATAEGGRYLFDLPGLVASRLAALGLDAIETLACDTYAGADRFFSYRRSTHRGETDYGRQLSAIALI